MKQYVIAGNYGQFCRWIRGSGLTFTDWIYVSSKDIIRGVRNPGGRFIGTWYLRDDAFDILVALRVASDVKNENLEKALLLWIELQGMKQYVSVI